MVAVRESIDSSGNQLPPHGVCAPVAIAPERLLTAPPIVRSEHSESFLILEGDGRVEDETTDQVAKEEDAEEELRDQGQLRARSGRDQGERQVSSGRAQAITRVCAGHWEGAWERVG